MYCYEYPRLMLTVDAIILKKEADCHYIVLIKRRNEPFKNSWALPGGFVEMDENLDEAVKRELNEETGLQDIHLIQFHTYGAVNRDPRGRTVSVVYYGILKSDSQNIIAGDDAMAASWFPLSNLPELAFDHEFIIKELNNFLQLDYR